MTDKDLNLPAQGNRTPRARRSGGTAPAPGMSSSDDGLPRSLPAGDRGASTIAEEERSSSRVIPGSLGNDFSAIPEVFDAQVSLRRVRSFDKMASLHRSGSSSSLRSAGSGRPVLEGLDPPERSLKRKVAEPLASASSSLCGEEVEVMDASGCDDEDDAVDAPLAPLNKKKKTRGGPATTSGHERRLTAAAQREERRITRERDEEEHHAFIIDAKAFASSKATKRHEREARVLAESYRDLPRRDLYNRALESINTLRKTQEGTAFMSGTSASSIIGAVNVLDAACLVYSMPDTEAISSMENKILNLQEEISSVRRENESLRGKLARLDERLASPPTQVSPGPQCRSVAALGSGGGPLGGSAMDIGRRGSLPTFLRPQEDLVEGESSGRFPPLPLSSDVKSGRSRASLPVGGGAGARSYQGGGRGLDLANPVTLTKFVEEVVMRVMAGRTPLPSSPVSRTADLRPPPLDE